MERLQDGIVRQRGRPRVEDTAEIDNALLAAALREFVENGYEGASMRSIAKAANVARTTLQLRYASKDALFQAIMAQQIERMSADTSLRFEGPPDLRKGLAAYADRALTYSLEGDYLEVNRLIYGSASRFPAVAAAAMNSTRVGIAQIGEFIARCAEADGIPCRNPRVPAKCFILMIRGWYGYAIVDERAVTKRERNRWIDEMVDTLMAGRANW